MKARKLKQRSAPSDLPLDKGDEEITGDFTVEYGDKVYILLPSKKWVYYSTAYGWAGDNSISLSKQIANPKIIRYARKKN